MENSSVDPVKRRQKILVIILISLIVIMGIVIALMVLKRNVLQSELDARYNDLASVTSTSSTTITSPTATTNKAKTTTATAETTSTIEPAATVSDEDLITKALSEKFSEDVSNLTVTINKKDNVAAVGNVSVNDEMSGGWFVAVKDGQSWKIIDDGNGVMECAVLDEYNVPSSIVGECYDIASEQSVTR